MKPGDKGWENSLERYIYAQNYASSVSKSTQYEIALKEIQAGAKESCWMWYIFPQIQGLGHSSMDATYSIRGIEEAKEYLAHPILGVRLKEIAQAVVGNGNSNPDEVFGYPDNLKLKSCMTLFEIAAEQDETVFKKVIEECYHGERDSLTINILKGRTKTKRD